MTENITEHRRYRISVVMIVKNEADNLKLSLPSVAGWADEIVILDSGSSDGSEAIARQYGAKWFVNTNWQGFGKQRQLAQSYATGDWILALDADEEIDAELKSQILMVTEQPPADTVYGVRRIDHIWGNAIDNPLWLVPIKSHWRLYPKSFNYDDSAVHEALAAENAQKKPLQGYVKHHTAPSPTFWLEKRLNYAITWAEERHEKGKQVNIFTVIGHAAGAFVKQYFIDGRFLCGKHGFVYAVLFAQYTFNKYAILYDLNRKARLAGAGL